MSTVKETVSPVEQVRHNSNPDDITCETLDISLTNIDVRPDEDLIEPDNESDTASIVNHESYSQLDPETDQYDENDNTNRNVESIYTMVTHILDNLNRGRES